MSTATATRTPSQELATVLLGVDVVEHIAQQRAAGARWADVLEDLAEKTGGRVRVTDRQLRTWLHDGGYASDGSRAPAIDEDPVDAEIRGVNEWVAEQRAMAAAR